MLSLLQSQLQFLLNVLLSNHAEVVSSWANGKVILRRSISSLELVEDSDEFGEVSVFFMDD
jgi:hypothetical protein